MIPKVNGRGHSFKGVVAYLMHDKEADTSERVAWHEVGNMPTDDPVKAAKIMAWTDCNALLLKQEAGGSRAGRQTEAGAVYHYSLSWAHGEAPDKEHQRAQILATLERLGLSEHQYIAVSHSDTEHTHVHIVANLTDHETGKRHDVGLDHPELQAWALEYERAHGIHCEQREINAALREQGEPIKYRDQKQDYSADVTRAYLASDSGKAFIHALAEHGLQLAAARRGNGFLVIDERGEIHKLARQLDIEETGKAKTAAINGLLADIDRDTLPDADRLAKELRERGSADITAPEADAPALEATPELTQENAPEDMHAITHEAETQQEENEAAATWETILEHAALLPDDVPQDVPEHPPEAAPDIEQGREQEKEGSRAQGLGYPLAAAYEWMQDKLVAAYEYISQKMRQNHEQQHDKGFR